MKIVLAQFTFASQKFRELKDYYQGILRESATLGDHEFYYTLQDKEDGGCLALVPHNGDATWDHPWLTLATDDFPAAIAHLKSLGITKIENSGPADEQGNPTHCVLFRDPEGRLIMLARLEE